VKHPYAGLVNSESFSTLNLHFPVRILRTAATGALLQHFLAIMRCGGWSSVSEDFEIRREGV